MVYFKNKTSTFLQFLLYKCKNTPLQCRKLTSKVWQTEVRNSFNMNSWNKNYDSRKAAAAKPVSKQTLHQRTNAFRL